MISALRSVTKDGCVSVKRAFLNHPFRTWNRSRQKSFNRSAMADLGFSTPDPCRIFFLRDLPRQKSPAFTSPALLGELSRLSPSDWEMQKTLPVMNGLVGNSRMWLLPTDWLPAFLKPSPNATG